MNEVERILDKLSTVDQRKWLVGYLQRKGIVISENQGQWNETVLNHLLSEAANRDPKFIIKIQNTWRQYKHKIQEKKHGVVTHKISLPKLVNDKLSLLTDSTKDTINVTIEKLIFDNYHLEMTDKRIDKLRQKEIKLSLEKAKAKTGRLQSLKKNLELKDGREKIAIELEQANIHIEEQVSANEELEFKLKELQKELEEKGSEFEKVHTELSAEKSLTSKLSKEIRQLNVL
jgi:myosin heavy subunit